MLPCLPIPQCPRRRHQRRTRTCCLRREPARHKRRSPYVPAPHVCTYAAPHPGAPGFMSLPPRQIPARGHLPCCATPCRHAQPWTPSHRLAVAGRINQQPQAVTAGLTQLGLSVPLCSSQWTGFPSFHPPILFYQGEQRRRHAVTLGRASSGKADLLSTGIARQDLLPRHRQGDSPPPNPSWHRARQKGVGGTLRTPPAQDLSATDQPQARWDPHAS